MNRAQRLLWPGLALVAGLATSACAEEAVSNPTWIDDVRPILAANCVRCHGRPAIAGAPDGFRLDKYGVTTLPDGSSVIGAALVTFSVADRAAEKGDMPPDYPLPDWQRETLRRWNTGDAPLLGERADNAAPVLVTPSELALSQSGPSSFAYEITDADADLVDGQLLARPAAGDDIVLSADLRSGRGDAQYDATGLEPGTYELVAALTDDLVTVEVSLGSFVRDGAASASSAARIGR